MKIETFEQRILTADDGMFLTNGETIAQTVVLGKTANIDDWREITDDEAKKMQEVTT